MKKLLLILCLVLVACESTEVTPQTITELKIVTAPIIDPQKMIDSLEILKPAIIEEFQKEGITIESVTIEVLTSHNATGEALSSSTAHIGLIGATTFVEYMNDGLVPLLAASRAKVNKDSTNPKDWNNQQPTLRDPAVLTSSIQALVLAGPSEKGQALANYVNNNEIIPWEVIQETQWCISSSTTSSIAYIYPNLWLYETYGKLFSDLVNQPLQGTFSDTISALALEQCDVGLGYSFILSDFEKAWNDDFKRKANIFSEVNVIGVTRHIQNDVVAVSENHIEVTEEFKLATINVFKRLVVREDMATAFKVFNILGYQEVNIEDYNDTIAAYEFVREKINE